MMTDSLNEWIALDVLPMELQRNFTLIRQLDERAEGRNKEGSITITQLIRIPIRSYGKSGERFDLILY